MPRQRPLTPEEIEYVRSLGQDPSQVVAEYPDEEMSTGRAIISRLKAGAGGFAGGGAGALLGGKGGAAVGTAIAPGPGTVVGGLVGAVGGGLIGAFGGQKVQEAVLPDETNRQLAEEAAIAGEQHPYVSGATDITAGALASGGAFSPRTAFRAGRALVGRKALSAADDLALAQVGKEALSVEGAEAFARRAGDVSALKNVGMQAAINPAIDVGQSLAMTGELPSGRQLISDVLGGALFARPSWLGKKFGGMTDMVEPSPEVNTKGLENIKIENQPVEVMPRGEQPLKMATTEDVVPGVAKKPKNTLSAEEEAQILAETGTLEEGAVGSMQKEKKDFIGNVGSMGEVDARNVPKAKFEMHNDYGMDSWNGWRYYADKNRVEWNNEPSPNAKESVNNFLYKKGIVDPTHANHYNKGEAYSMQREAPTKQDYSPEDLQRYNDLQSSIKDKQNTNKMDSFQEIETLKNKYGGMPPKQLDVSPVGEEVKAGQFTAKYFARIKGLDTHIQTNKDATTGSVLQRISDSTNEFSEMAKHLLTISDGESLKTPWSTQLKAGEVLRSHYTIPGDAVKIRPDDIHDTRVIMEEAIHSLTSKKLDLFKTAKGSELKNRMDTYLKTGDNQAVKDLISSYYKTAENLGLEHIFVDPKEQYYNKTVRGPAGDPDKVVATVGGDRDVAYAVGDLHEFLAHAFKNEKFQNLLNEMPSDVPGKSIWQKIVDSVRRLLGFDVKQGSMLEHVLRTGSEIISQERPGSKTPTGGKDVVGSAPSQQPISVISKDPSKKGFLRPLEATFDKVKRDSVVIGEAGERWEKRRDTFLGLKNTAVVDLQQFNPKEVDKVTAMHREAYRSDLPLPRLTSTQQKISDIIKGYYTKIGETRREIGLKINERRAGLNPLYVPDQLNDNTLDLFSNHALSPEAIYAKNRWIDHIMKETKGTMSRDKINDDITDYIAALGGKSNNYNSVKFGAIRRAAGYGLPEGLRELNGINSLNKYGSRAASDLAMFMELESKPVIAASLKLTDPNTGQLVTHPDANPDLSTSNHIRDMMKWVTDGFAGTMSSATPKVNALVRLINNSILGTATGIRDTVQMPVMALPYINKFSDLSSAMKGILNYRNESRNALMTGARKPSIDKVQFDSMMEGPDQFTSLVSKAATLMRKYQGREFLENLNRDITFSVGKELARNNIIGAKNGHKQSKAFLEKFGLLVDKDITTLQGDELEKFLNQVAKNFTDRNQGTYGGSGLPAGIIESQFAPFFALQKWSVEKSNVIYKDVVKPFMTGENHLPLISYTLGSVLTGAAIQQLNELITGRKSQDPTVSEALSEGSAKSIVGELATLMQLSSLGGIVGDSLKFVADVGLYGKTPRNIVSFPTATAALDFQERTTDMVEALKNGEDAWDVWKAYTLDVLTHNIQLARAVANHSVNKEDVARSDKFRDLRVFNQLEGGKASDVPKVNKYLDMDAKEFKRTGDLQEAATLLPGLLKKAITDSEGDPYVLMQKLRSLKGNSFQIMPNFESLPLKFARYVQFLRNTQGEEEATKRLEEYVTQGAVNQVKSAMVP